MILAMLAYLIPTILLLWVIWWYIQFYKFDKHLTMFRGPTPLPLLGMVHKGLDLTKVLHVGIEFQKKFGSPFKVMLLHRTYLIVSDYKTVELLLANISFKKLWEYRFLEPWFGKGLVTSSGNEWKVGRKLLNPAFHSQILEKFVPIMNSQSDTLLSKLRKSMVNGVPLNIYPPIALCGLDIICETAMGTSVNAQNDPNCKYVQYASEIFRITMSRVTSPFKMFDFLYVFSKDYWKQRKIVRYLREYGYSIIARRRAELAEKGHNETNMDSTAKEKFALLDLMLQCKVDGQPLKDEVIRNHVDTFIAAGHDTTASGSSFTLYCLSKNLEIQKKVFDELKQIYAGDYQKPLSCRDLQEMKYMEMVIKESLRLYPSIAVFGRYVHKNAKLGDVVFPHGMRMAVFIYGLHRQPDVFPDPEKFDPERFSPENSCNRPPFAYIPFSVGPRQCIGHRFALLEMKVMIAKILINFELLPVLDHTPRLHASVVLKSTNGLPVILKQRQL